MKGPGFLTLSSLGHRTLVWRPAERKQRGERKETPIYTDENEMKRKEAQL